MVDWLVSLSPCSASFWSLVGPAIERVPEKGAVAWLAVSIGIDFGGSFGAACHSNDLRVTMLAVLSRAIGIGIQDFPEGAVVSIPLQQEGLSQKKAFFYGQASDIVEPIAGVIGAILVTRMTILLPYVLAFAAGVMIDVVVEELIPEVQLSSDRHFGVFKTMAGFVIMMILDVALG